MGCTSRDTMFCPCNIAFIPDHAGVATTLSLKCLYGNVSWFYTIYGRNLSCNGIDSFFILSFETLCREDVERYGRCEAVKAIRLSFFQMLQYMRRDMMLFVACFAPILAGLMFRYAIPFLEIVLTDLFNLPAIISPYYALIDIFFAMLSPVMFCFVSAMVSLEEVDENTAAYLFITPLGKTGYLAARFGVPAVIAFIITTILLPVFKLTSLSFVEIISLTIGGTLQGIIISLLIVTLSSNKLEGMAVTKLSTLMIFGAVIPFFIKHNIQYVLFLLPAFWIGKAISENTPFYVLLAFALSAIWIFFLLKQYER